MSQQPTNNRNEPKAQSAERRLTELGIVLPAPPQPFGMYVESVQSGSLLFLTGMLATEAGRAKYAGRVGAELDAEAGRAAARVAALNGLAVAREHLGSLDKIARIIRLGVAIATTGENNFRGGLIDGSNDSPRCSPYCFPLR